MKLLKIWIVVALCISTAVAKNYGQVNGEAVTSQDIENMMKNFPKLGQFDKLKDDQQKIIIDQAIDSKLSKQLAVKNKIPQTKLYKDSLKAIEDKLLVEVWMKITHDSIKVSASEIKAHYNKNKKEYITNHEIKARHIILKTKKEADGVVKLLQKENEATLQKTFINLAVKRSIGPTASNGGSLGWFDKNKMLKSFWDVCVSLKQNQFATTPLKTEFGYHIIYVDGVQPAYVVSLADASKDIKEKLKGIKFQKKISKDIKTFRQKSNIKRY